MKRFSFYTTLVLIAVSLTNSSFGQEGDVELKTIKDPSYSISYPMSWDINKTSGVGINLIMIAPVDSKEDKFRENITLVLQDVIGKDTNPDYFGSTSTDQIIAGMDNSMIESKGMVNENGVDFYKAIYSGKQRGMNVRYEQRYYVKGNRAYVFTISGEVESAANYERVFGQILDSFEFVD